MTIAGRLRERRYAPAIEDRAALYDGSPDEAERLETQLGLWNREWKRVQSSVPFYRDLCRKGKAPSEFRSWNEFLESVPITTRSRVQSEKNRLVSTERPEEFRRMTGGSTAEPVQIPAWHSEQAHTGIDMWLARGWYGITPSSRLFMLWGHSHLLGKGLRGWINGQLRRMRDGAVGYYRFSAYNLEPEMLRRAARELTRFRPDYMIGYSVALDLFARANIKGGVDLGDLDMKVVVGAAEAFPTKDSESLLTGMLRCPVAMEYGSVETGLIGHSHPDGGYRVFWKTYFLEAERSESSSAWQVRVTSLYPRCFPLVRYEMGDEILFAEARDDLVTGVDSFERVLGRCNDYIVLSDGFTVHSEVFTHAVRPCEAIMSYQVVQAEGDLRIRYIAAAPLSRPDLDDIRTRLDRVHPELRHIPVERVAKLEQTIAGKTRMVIRK